MAQASADPDKRDLEQRILQVLKDAGSPVKTAQLAKECQVLKKRLNQVLYGMKKELKVDLVGRATWRLGVGGTGEVVPTEPAQPSHEEQIYRFLKAGGPCKALVIAQSLGMKTAKDVNPDLYDMRRKHLLDLDQNSKAWAIYQPGRPLPAPIVYQQNPITICQNAPHSRISINNSEAVQIGHGNSIVRQTAPGESGFTAPLYLPQPAPADPSTQDALAGSREPQDIYIDKSVLKRVQLGHSNEMSLYSTPAMGPGHSPSVSTSDTTAGPEASFEVRMPTPGPSPEGKGDTTQRVHIKSCFLEEVAIGNSNRMSVGLAAAGPGGGAGPEDSSGDPGEPTEDAKPQSGAAEPRGKSPHYDGRADPNMSTFTSHLEAMTLEGKDPEAAEDGP
ncbi:PREDICTED: Z-DNA-binding protein 1 [Miniopterus natalensis]|uniref:Z-DNA-binding protein 1 n=1 Tax=Miniopterus natalensis TaxID=291302 RepID=UPI0007A71416|nr:PREDICTED: Z-DNA-binding protein 1 [Miniopterus natalensis]